jgi:Ser/Thr protein kinase RdoA (MazF antagonist)
LHRQVLEKAVFRLGGGRSAAWRDLTFWPAEVLRFLNGKPMSKPSSPKPSPEELEKAKRFLDRLDQAARRTPAYRQKLEALEKAARLKPVSKFVN